MHALIWRFQLGRRDICIMQLSAGLDKSRADKSAWPRHFDSPSASSVVFRSDKAHPHERKPLRRAGEHQKLENRPWRIRFVVRKIDARDEDLRATAPSKSNREAIRCSINDRRECQRVNAAGRSLSAVITILWRIRCRAIIGFLDRLRLPISDRLESDRINR